ncbi:hypothetical protein Sste5346_004592 [Sporothrix stenoceras]|uniref:Beta-glucuronidase C-terminal domain-containing protein n=1 Tax=Sporothrix stenoceras TaxID=5173 RepID=A0ABR3Z7B8_9PEZI
MSIGIQQLYFHQGTINQEYFNWFSSNGTGQINAPFYGGYFAALAVADADRIVALDSGNSSYAQYGIYKNGSPSRAVFINTDYFSGGDGCRNNTAFTLFGLGGKRNVRALRMTAASSEVILGPTPGGPAGHITIGGSFLMTPCSFSRDLSSLANRVSRSILRQFQLRKGGQASI